MDHLWQISKQYISNKVEERLIEQKEGVQNKFVYINVINLCLVKENAHFI